MSGALQKHLNHMRDAARPVWSRLESECRAIGIASRHPDKPALPWNAPRMVRKLQRLRDEADSSWQGIGWRDLARREIRQLSPEGIWQKPEHMARFSSSKDRAYYCDKWPAWARNIRPCDDRRIWDGYGGIDHTGWYSNAFEDGETDTDSGTIRGYVMQLAGRKGKPVYVPGWSESDCDGVTIYPLDQYDDERECARAADDWAERIAESEREFHAAESRTFRIEELRREIAGIRADLRALIRELKTVCRARLGDSLPRIKEALRDKINSLREDGHKAWARIRKLESMS